MATLSTTGLYPEDLNGTNPLNLIVGEVQTLTVPGKDDYFFIIPRAAPFFVDSLVVTNALTGVKYNENDDYLVGHWFVEAMDSVGRPIAGSIRFMKRNITGQVKLTYRTIGGNWGFSDAQILAELNRKTLNPLIRSWGSVGELPYSFPPLEHDQSIDSLVGSAEIEAALKRLADVIDAMSSGTSESHLRDYNNPHRVTKAQVLLGLVQNYGMATSAEAITGTAADRYMSPVTTLAAINNKAVVPMTTHINARGNVHGLAAADINLGNLPNYAAASATQAIDVNNNNTLMTPYTSSLLIQRLTGSIRIDELENKVNLHLADTTGNPHKITPAMIGTLTTQQIQARIDASGASNATTFGGKTPEEWAGDFVNQLDFDDFIGPDELFTFFKDSADSVMNVVSTPPFSDAELATALAKVITGVDTGFAAYGVTNNNNVTRMVVATPTVMPPTANPSYTEYLAAGKNRWVDLENARYYITARGGVITTGTAGIAAAVGTKDDAGFLAAKAAKGIWASKTELYAQLNATGEIRMFKADNTDSQIAAAVAWTPGGTGRMPVAMHVATQRTLAGSMAVVQVDVTTGATEATKVVTKDFVPIGDATFVANMNTVMATIKATDSIVDMAFGDNNILVLTKTRGAFMLVIDRTVPTAIKVTLPASPLVNNGNGKTVSLRSAAMINNFGTGEGVSAISGKYGHFVMVTNKGKVWFYGDNSFGQCDVQPDGGDAIAVGAGYGFSVIVNKHNQPTFFGNSPDNSLLYSYRSTTIDAANTSEVWYK